MPWPRVRLPWSATGVRDEPTPANAEITAGTSTAIGSEKNNSVDSKSAAAAITAEKDLRKIQKSHQYDPNLGRDKLDALRAAAESDDIEKIQNVDAEFIEESPYESVRAAVRNTDPDVPANTVRAWILGLIFVTIGSGLNMFLSMRSPAVSFPGLVVMLVVYPIGVFWAKVVPTRKFNTFGVEWTFNPGPFNIKEHTVVGIMSVVSISFAYSTDALLALKAKPFYNLDLGWGFQLLSTLSSQLIGLALAGLARRFLVWPSALLWPNQFSNTSLLYALHDHRQSNPSETNGWSISRYRWFLYVTLGAFCWYWVPATLWQGLSVFAFPAWIAPNNVVVNQLFGGYTGLSLIPLTFDWTYISAYLLSPMLAPYHTHINTLIGLIVFVVVSAIGISYTGAWYSDYLPMSTSVTYDNTGGEYNVFKVLNKDFSFDLAKYKKYSPMFLAPTFALNYGLAFAALTACLVHIGIFHGQELWYRFKAAREQEPDVHMKMMKKYVECPDWWYVALLVIALALGLATALGYESQLPWWAFFVSNIIGMIFMVPACMIYGMTNIPLALNVLSPYLAGFMIPGKPIGVMLFKVFSVTTLGQAQTFSGDLKFAHYMKIPPRTVFTSQIVASIWACFVQVAVMNWTLGNIDGACTPTQKAHFTCPNGSAFFRSSITWGVIGPSRMLGPNSVYKDLNWFWLIGAALPVVFWGLTRMFPRSPLRLLNAPVMLGAMEWLPPATALSFFSWAIVGLIFNMYIMRRFLGWWHQYNYVTSAALDSGLIISTIAVFFAISYKEIEVPQWWGNTVPYTTMDYLYTAVRTTVGKGETFGPATW